MTVSRAIAIGVASVTIGLLSTPIGCAWAQKSTAGGVVRHAHRVVLALRKEIVASPAPLTERRLTIQRRSLGSSPEVGDDDIYLDGNVRYNNIQAFDPAPYADSGRQYPFGLDGIGGYGSDLGYGAGHDDATYDRGP